MTRQDEVEDFLLRKCPICGDSENIIDIYLRDVPDPTDGIISNESVYINISSEWEGRICTECGIAWAVPTWVSTENDW